MFMVLIHVMETYGRPDVQAGAMGKVLLFLGQAPAAPVFMFLMGIGVTLTSTPSSMYFLKRGGQLFLLGYALNFLRGTLPLWIALQEGNVTVEEAAPYTPLSELLVGDIFQFAGAALPVCGLIYFWRVSPYVVLSMGLAIAFLSPALWGLKAGVAWLDWILALLWGDGMGICFPVFPWIVFPLFGAALGMLAQARGATSDILRPYFGWGVGLLGFGLALLTVFPQLGSERYARSGPGSLLWMCGFVIVWIRVCAALVQVVKTHALVDLLYFWSERVARFYFIHWVLLGWGIGLFGAESSDELTVALLAIGALFLSDLLTRMSLAWSSRPSRRAERATA